MRIFARNTLLVISISALFVACSDKKDEFKIAINDQFDKSCIEIKERLNFPKELQLNAYDKPTYDVFAKFGLAKSTPKQVQTFGLRTYEDGLEYELTDLGKQFFVEMTKNNYTLCAGKYKVTEILNYTEPADNMMGVKMSQVNFKKEAVNVPDWAYELVKEKPFENDARLISKEAKENEIVLILTNDGWVTEKEFKK